MSFALCKKVPRFKLHPEKLPLVAMSCGNKVLEVEIVHVGHAYDSLDFYYEEKEVAQKIHQNDDVSTNI